MYPSHIPYVPLPYPLCTPPISPMYPSHISYVPLLYLLCTPPISPMYPSHISYMYPSHIPYVPLPYLLCTPPISPMYPSLPPPQVVFLGDSGVGKTSLIRRLTCGHFGTPPSTLGLDYNTCVVTVGEERVAFQLWDTAGQERSVGVVYCIMTISSLYTCTHTHTHTSQVPIHDCSVFQTS